MPSLVTLERGANRARMIRALRELARLLDSAGRSLACAAANAETDETRLVQLLQDLGALAASHELILNSYESLRRQKD